MIPATILAYVCVVFGVYAMLRLMGVRSLWPMAVAAVVALLFATGFLVIVTIVLPSGSM